MSNHRCDEVLGISRTGERGIGGAAGETDPSSAPGSGRLSEQHVISLVW